MEEQTKPIRVRIEHDGNSPSYNAKITDAETGAEIQHVKSAELRLDADRGGLIPRVYLEVYAPLIDIIADAEVKHICPCCGCPVAPPLQGDTADDDPFALDPKL